MKGRVCDEHRSFLECCCAVVHLRDGGEYINLPLRSRAREDVAEELLLRKCALGDGSPGLVEFKDVPPTVVEHWNNTFSNDEEETLWQMTLKATFVCVVRTYLNTPRCHMLL